VESLVVIFENFAFLDGGFVFWTFGFRLLKLRFPFGGEVPLVDVSLRPIIA
jgi:hypothetical protein